ncbi:acetoin utilization protein [Roseivivax halodurans JCM 10272]|uniref:Acetoin utilization protein AcuC n=1 Tax=Roseivivax halodurans JCM 10272 TaxID=1449350 RepID=X7EET2_9RHOB|nr:acetoin utilization protein [Roseivivax halodurans]ETX14604.1 acetoin utilization protein [Roseivivax halodurans JCM 10272]
MTGARFIGSNVYRGSRYGKLHPLSIERVPAVIDICRALGWLPPEVYRTSPMAKPAALTGFHSVRYVAALQEAEAAQSVSSEVRERHGLGTLSNPVFPEMYRRPATAAGGGLLAADLVARGGVVHNPGGGTHHGLPDRASGFCYLNEPVLTMQRLLAIGLERIAYVDIDAHHCDGVAIAFEGSRQVRMISVHEAGRWPFTGAAEDDAGGAAINLPVPKGFNDSEFALLLNEVILPAVEAFRPDAIFLQCGADAVTEDPLSRLALSNLCHWRTVAALRPLSPRMIVSGGGGYNPWTTARLWSGVWATLSGAEIPERLPAEVSDILRGLDWSRRGRPSEALLTTLADAPRPGPVRSEIRELARTVGRFVA